MLLLMMLLKFHKQIKSEAMLTYVFAFCKNVLIHVINTFFNSVEVPVFWKKSLEIPLVKVLMAIEMKIEDS